jgi:chitinase
MTYDFYTGGAPVTGFHTNLNLSVHDDARRRSAIQSVQGHIDAGVPPEKIVLGVAFYGRGWTDVNDENNGLFQMVNGEGISFPYGILAKEYIDKNGFVRYWDESAQAPYLWNAETKTFISYDDVESLTYKAAFVKTQGLGGVMFWEYSQDTEGVLLNTLFTQLLSSDEM